MGNEADGKNAAVALAAIKVLLGLVFMGWLMIWIMMPTNTYVETWYPKIWEDTNSTFFGAQGTYILIHTFPILFISVLGCIYLHLAKEGSIKQRGSMSRRLSFWKRPLLAKGPLGTVSYIEFTFCLMFIVLLIWYFSSYVTVSFSDINEQSAAEEGLKVWQAKLQSVALRIGLLGNVCLAFLFFPITRGSSILPLLGLTSDGSVKYHIWLGHITMVLFTAHGLCYIILWAATNEISQMVKWDKVGVANIAGELSLLSGLVLWATSFSPIRRKMFELFFYTHQLYILFLLFFLLHLGITFISLTLPGIYLFIVDRYLRFLQSRQKVRLVSTRLLPSETVELNFVKSTVLKYNPMSSVFVNVPAISRLQWHPFTISSNSNFEPDRLSVIIKKEGSWSQKLFQTLSSSLDRLDVSIEGPYGPVSTDFLRYESLILVSGGSGIAPFMSIIRELIFRSTTLKRQVPTVRLICAFKTSADLTMLDLLLPSSSNISDMSRMPLRIEAYVTREVEPDGDARKLIRTIWFKPNPSDLPISPVLGPNGWLWLGAIISVSFVGFLLLMGIVNRYYIYPIDKNTGQVYSTSARALLNLLFISVCIAAAASAAVLCNKEGNSVETRQIQSTNAVSPPLTPGSWLNNADRELEALPYESLIQATKVHYGARPDLNIILLEREDLEAGVLVSGPSSMRHEVAKVCCSGLAKNLHFESISFSW